MKLRRIYTRLLLLGSVLSLSPDSLQAEDWARFRGSDGSGISSSDRIPTTWSNQKNLRWSTDLAGPGSSCPIVIGDRVILTYYTGYGQSAEAPGTASDLVRHVLCLDRKSGTSIWSTPIKSTFDEDPYKGFIVEHGFASTTPTSDGKMIYVACGKSGLIALNMEGNEVWRAPLGKLSDPAQWGDGASPVLYKNLVIMNAGITDHSIVAFDKTTGKEVWKRIDEKFTNSWGTPIIVQASGRDELVHASPGKIFAIHPETGTDLWTCDSPLKETVCASVVHDAGIVYLMGGRAGQAVAVRCGGNGDVSATHKVWEKPLRSGIGTPVAINGRLYWSSSGLAICADCKTGDEVFKARLSGSKEDASSGGRRPQGNYASTIAVGGKVFVLLRNGEMQVWNATDKYEVISSNLFDGDEGPFNATPAVSDDQMFVRSNKKLYCIAKNNQ
jgi:outer membrane protein assembly factor BamB